MMKKNIFFIFLLQAAFVVAQLPSIIKDDYIIRKSMSPLTFNKTYVTKDAVLSIEPGVVLEGNKLEVDGTLILVGKEKDSITIRIKELLTKGKIVAKYCKFNHTGLSAFSFEDEGAGVFKNCVFSNSGLDNCCKTLTCEDNLFVNTSVQNRNGIATYKDNVFKSVAFSIKEYGAATIDHNQFLNTMYKTIDIDRGRIEGAVITIKNNHFELDSIFNINRNENIAIRTEFATPSDRTILITNNVFKNYQTAFVLEVDYNGAYKCETTHLSITGNEVQHCNTILSVNPDIRCMLGSFTVKNNRFSTFKTAFIDVGTQSKNDKTAFIPYRINKNKYDVPLTELLKRIDDFTGDYEKWIRFEVEY
jgi:hypothetical protein